jgi:FixJ family two-component response regulator
MLIRNTSVLGTRLRSLLARSVFLTSLLRRAVPEIRRQTVISIVDDNASFRGAIKRLIESADLAVEEFASAEEFLLSGRYQDSACLIVDLQLNGMSGLELQKQLQALNPRLPVIFMSASADEMSRARALRSGAIEFLEKPINDQALFAAIDASFILFHSGVSRLAGSPGSG